MPTTLSLLSRHLVMHWAGVIMEVDGSDEESGAILLSPLRDGVVITFVGAAFGFLARPAQASENMPEAAGVAGHTEAEIDQFGHPRQSPDYLG